MAVAASSPFHEGRALRRARQRRRVTLDEAAEATRISRRFLDALERESPVDEFPAPVYARAFLREYARYLHLDPEPLVEAFTARNGVREPPVEAILATVVAPQRRWPGRLLAAISVAAVVALAVARLSASSSVPPQRAATVAPTNAAAAAVALPLAGPTKPMDLRSPPGPPAYRGIDVVLRLTGPCWVTATADGAVAFAPRTLAPGQTVTITARHTLVIRLGNAGGVQVTVNGRRVTAGAPGHVVNLSYAWRNGRLVSL